MAGVVQRVSDHPHADTFGDAELPKGWAGQPIVMCVALPRRTS